MSGISPTYANYGGTTSSPTHQLNINKTRCYSNVLSSIRSVIRTFYRLNVLLFQYSVTQTK